MYAHSDSCASSSSPPSPDPREARDIFQAIVQGRKSWKTLKGNTEPVWPPELEAALLEGLELYQPDDSRETRLLGRFPMRNRFISDHIFRTTGRRRSAKQVGSRLQQLRDTCGGKQLLKLLSPRVRRPGLTRMPSLSSDGSQYSDSSQLSSPVTPADTLAASPAAVARALDACAPPRTTIHIEVSPEHVPFSPLSTPSDARHSPPSPSSSTSSRDSDVYRPLRSIDPTVTFTSRAQHAAASSFFTVYHDYDVVHTEITPLRTIAPPADAADDTAFYSTVLVPAYWAALCDSPDPTRYTIVHDVHASTSNDAQPPSLFSAVYKIVYAMASPPLRPHRTPTPAGIDDAALLDASLDSLFREHPFFALPASADGDADFFDAFALSAGPQAASDAHASLSHCGGPAHARKSSSPPTTCFPAELSNYISI